jgi:ketosteroid isomerase-like protein
MSDGDRQAVIEATHSFYAALNAMLAGDPNPLADVYSHAADVTYMPAEGGLLVGWDQVFADWSRQAEASRGGTAEAEEVQAVAGEDMAASQALTSGTITGTDGETRQVQLRESSAFRKEDGNWKMIAHHADAIPTWGEVVEDTRRG